MTSFIGKSRYFHVVFLICVWGSLAIYTSSATAEDLQNSRNHIGVEFGLFFADVDTKLRKSSSTLGIGTLIDFEDDLGFDKDETIAQFKIYKRFSERHLIAFTYLKSSREGVTVSDKPIIIDDTIFPPGTRLESKFDIQVYKLNYGYSFYQSPKVDLGVIGGIYVLDSDVQIVSPIDNEESDDALGFPSIGLGLTYVINESFNFSATGEIFKISEGDAEADVAEFNIAVDYKLTDRYRLGLRYCYVSLEGEDTKDNDELDMSYDGPMIFVTALF